MGKKKESPFTTYIVASQLGFTILTPLLVFIVGGSWLVNKFQLPSWVLTVLIIIGILTMISGAVSYLYKLIKQFGKDDESKIKLYSSRKDNDYYDDNKGKNKL